MSSTPFRTVALYERILEAVPGGVVYVAADGTLLLANDPAQQFLGLRLDQSGQRFVVDFDGETYNEDGSTCSVEDYPVSRCLATGEAQAPRVIGVRQPSGKIRWAVFTALPFDPGDGNPHGAVVSFVDITERKEAEDEVRRLQTELTLRDRLATIGTLAAAVAHEVNNPLAFMFLGLDNIRQQLTERADPELTIGDLEDVLDGARRVRDIVRDLMTFSRTRDGDDELTDVASAVETAVRLAAPEVRYRSEITLDLVDGADARIAPGRLSQVILNLVLNAGRSFPDDHPTPRIDVLSRVTGDTVQIDVVDNGPGVDPQLVDRIFDPFFSTASEGTGLGLSISRSLVEEVGGTLELVPTTERGARFRVTLRATAAEPAESRDESTSPLVSRRILLVDDESAIRRFAEAALSPHDVHAADSVAGAIEALTNDAFDAVICDTMLLDGSGIDVFLWVQDNRPELARRFLFITGGIFTTEVDAFFATKDVPCVRKPFERDEILHRAQALFDAAQDE